MDKDFVKKNGLTEALNKFKMLSEYTFITSPTLNEVGDDDSDTQGDDASGDGQDAAGGDPSQAGADPSMDAPDAGGQDPNAAPPQGGDPGMDPSAGGDQGGFPAPQGAAGDGSDMGGDPNAMPQDDGSQAGGLQPDDQVIDVDDLTDAQEDTEKKVDKINGNLDDVDDRIGKLLKVVDKFQTALDQNSEKIKDLQADLQRRMPTDQEKIDLRTHESGPFNIKPGNYWEQFNAENPNYDVTVNGQKPGDDEGEYTLRNSEVKGINDFDVSRSFDDPTQRHPLSDYLSL